MRIDPLALSIAALTLVGLGALGFGFVAVFSGKGEKLARRLVEPTPQASDAAYALENRPARGGGLARFVKPIAQIAAPLRREEMARLELRLQQGGIGNEHAPVIFLAGKVVLAMLCLGSFLWINAQRPDRVQPAFFVAIVAFASGFYAPELWLRGRIQARQTAMERALPDALDLLVTCVEAGLGLDAALQRVADEIGRAWPTLSRELVSTFLEIKAGIRRIDAFRRLAVRTGVADLKSLAATLTQTETFGTSIALALRVQAEGMRIRRMQRAEERAAYVAVKMTLPLILCILPSLLALVMGPAIVNISSNLLPALRGN